MKNYFPPNINPELFTITAIIVGLIIEDDYTADELNSIGNWLILVGQITLTTSAQQQTINNRYQNNIGSRIRSDSKNHNLKNVPLANYQDINMIIDEIEAIKNEINQLKKDK